MRVFMVVVLVSVLVLAAWANNTTDAGASQAGATSSATPTILNDIWQDPEF